MKLSVIMPVYNEEATILEVLDRVEAVPIEKEIILINDCSTDKTRELLDNRPPSDQLKIYHHTVNQGKGAAIRTAQMHITGDVMIIQDADLEYDPAEYPKMFKLFEAGKADVVYGSRYSGTEILVDTNIHYLGNKLLTITSNFFTNLHLTDMETCYKMIRADLFKNMTIECPCFGFEPEVTAKLAKQDIRIWEVPISYVARRFDEGKKIGWRDGVKAFWYIFKFNVLR
jgi:glycosyltransferase involved in cell wall biosynthesis